MMLRAIIRRGKYKDLEVEVSQWCNDWFTVDSRANKNLTDADHQRIMTGAWSPSSLCFTKETIDYIIGHKNNGMLFSWFELTMAPVLAYKMGYTHTFKRRKHGTVLR